MRIVPVALVLGLSAACGGRTSSSSGGRGMPVVTTTEPNEPGSLPRDPPRASLDAHELRAVQYQHFDINHVLSTGQGNAVANDATPPITVEQPYGNLKLDVGVITARQCDAVGCRSYARPTGFVPLVEGDAFYGYGVETMSSGLANEVSMLADGRARAGKPAPPHVMLVSLHGRTDGTYACLRKGGCDFAGAASGYVPPFDDAMMEVADAMGLAKAAGKSYVVRAVTAIHGESDHRAYATSVESYAGDMAEWQKDYEDNVQGITGQSVPIPLLMLQMSNWNDVPHSAVPIAMLAAHVSKAPGKVVVVTPGYPIGYASDCQHFTNHGERRIGEYFAKAYARIVLEGRPWEPLRPVGVTLRENVVTAKLIVPRPPLVLDKERVTDPGNYGFEFTDDSASPPAIASVAISGPDTVAITLASVPTGTNKRLRYAYTATPLACPGVHSGPRGNLRDSDDTPSIYGYDLANWCVHFDEAVD